MVLGLLPSWWSPLHSGQFRWTEGVQEEESEMRYQFIDRKQMLFEPQSPYSSLSEVQPVELPLLENQADVGP